jgi:hypothetical protein
MAIQFYRGPNRDSYLARVDSASQAREVLWENPYRWAPYPELDTLTEAVPISRERALQWAPGVTEALLDAPGGQQ